MTVKSSSINDDRSSTAPTGDPTGVIHDPYAILGVSRDASYELIRRVYREKAKVCHPDLGSEPGREEEFKLLNWAHRIVGEQHRESRRPRNDSSARMAEAAVANSPVPAPRSENSEILEEGRDRLKFGSAVEAERLARVALQRARGETAAYVLLAEALAAQRRFAEATGCLLMALQIDKNCEEARTILTRLQDRSKSSVAD